MARRARSSAKTARPFEPKQDRHVAVSQAFVGKRVMNAVLGFPEPKKAKTETRPLVEGEEGKKAMR